jgi:O-antigen/teichoic acid export membrane protein
MTMPYSWREEIGAMLASFRRKSARGLLRDAFIVGSGSVGAQLFAILLIPVITRMFSVSNFGVMTTFTAVTVTVAVFGNGSYDQAINLPKEGSKAWSLFCLCIAIASVFSSAVFLVTIIFEHKISQFIFGVAHSKLVFLVPLTVLSYNINIAMLFLTIRMRGFKMLSGSAFLGTAANQGSKVAGGWLLGDKLWLLVTGSFLQSCIPCFFLGAYIFRKMPKDIIRLPGKSELRALMVEYKNFPLYSTWVEFLLNLNRNITIILLAAAYSSAVVGIYGLANNVFRLPLSIIGDSFRQVCLPRFSALMNDKMPIRGLFVKVLLGIAVLVVIPFAVIIAFGPQLFSLVFGQRWAEAGAYARIISPWLFMMVFLPPVSVILVIMQKQRVRLAFNIILTAFQVAMLIMAKTIQIDILTLLGALSVGSSVIYAYKIFYAFHLIKGYERSYSRAINIG